jgi:PAS domain S-box-containing protein
MDRAAPAHDVLTSLESVVWEADLGTGRPRLLVGQPEAVLGYPPEEWLARPDFWPRILHPDDRERVLAARRHAPTAATAEVEYRVRRRDTRVAWLRDRLVVVSDPSGGRLRAITGTIAVPGSAQVALLHTVAGAITRAGELDNVLVEVLRAVGQATGAALGEAWVPGGEPERLECRATWCRDRPGLDELAHAAKTLGCAPGEDLPGRAWTARRPLWVRSVAADPGFRRAASARRAGVGSALALPIAVGREVSGVLALYILESRDEDEELVRLLSTVAAQLAAVVGRSRVDRALRESEARYRDLFEQAHDLVFTQDMAGRILSLNPAGEGLTGYARAGAGLMTVADLLAPASQSRARAALTHMLETREPAVYEVEMVTRDGRLVPLEVESRLILRDGQPVGLQSTARRLGGRQEAEPAPREGDARFRQLADAAPLPMWTADADGRRSFFNAAWLDFRGRSPGEEAGEGWLEGLHPEDRPQVVGLLREAIPAGRPYRIEYRLQRADGQYRWLLESACPHRGAGGAVAGYVGSASDVTDHRVAEGERARLREELRQAEGLRALGQLAGAIAHDFNNALAAIVGNVELVRATLPPGSAEADYADEALKGGWRAQEMVRQLLTLGRRKAPPPRRGPGMEGSAPEAPGAGEPAEAGRERILLVDDDAGLVDLWWRLLGVFGYDVVGRTDPREALALLRLMPDAFDVVVTDDVMPGFSGQALASEVFRIRPDLPVILLTGSDPDAPPEVLAESGLRAVVLKPATVQDLAAAIRRVRPPRPLEEPPRAAR